LFAEIVQEISEFRVEYVMRNASALHSAPCSLGWAAKIGRNFVLFVVCWVMSPIALATVQDDLLPEVEWRIANATAVLLAHVPTQEEARFHLPDMSSYWIVDEVLKGVETRRYIPRSGAPGTDAPPGARGLVLQPLREAPYLPVTTEGVSSSGSEAEAMQWESVTEQGGELIVQLEPALWTKGGRGANGAVLMNPVPLETLRKAILADEANLQVQMIGALFFPERFGNVVRTNPTKAAYVRMRLAICDLGRNVPALADLLEWPDASLRAAVEQRLARLTGAKLEVPAVAEAAALAAHAKAWRDWWSAHRAGLVWRESTGAFATRPAGTDAIADRWPEIPTPMVMPPESLSVAVKETLARGVPDPEGFAAAMRAFIDGGARRDEALLAASKVMWNYPLGEAVPAQPAWLKVFEERIAKGPLRSPGVENAGETPEGSVMQALFPNCMFGGSGPYLPPAPMLDSQLVFSADVPLETRWRVIANYVRYECWSASVAERQAALAVLTNRQSLRPGEYLRRAAFWEPYAEYPERTIAEEVFSRLRESTDPADLKFLRELMEALPNNPLAAEAGTMVLQKSGTPEDQNRLAGLFLANPGGGAGAAVFHAAKAGQRVLIDRITEDLKTSNGERFRRAAEALTSALVSSANPTIAARLSDSDDLVRQAAARYLTFNVTTEIEPALLAAWEEEKVPAVRQELIQAISHVHDARALPWLLAAANEKWPEGYVYEAIAMGMRTFNDPKALPVLARLSATYRDDPMNRKVVYEAVISFGAISGLFPVPKPSPGIWQSHSIDPALQAAALSIIDQWRKEH
jgi:hypothetical protein